MRTPDTAHLSPEDAALVEALYLERWADLPRAEATAVQLAAQADRQPPERHARHAA